MFNRSTQSQGKPFIGINSCLYRHNRISPSVKFQFLHFRRFPLYLLFSADSSLTALLLYHNELTALIAALNGNAGKIPKIRVPMMPIATAYFNGVELNATVDSFASPFIYILTTTER